MENATAVSGLSVPVNVSASLNLAGELAVSVLKHPIVFGLRRLFVLVTPSETSWEKLEDVPNYVTQAFPFFFAFLILEMIIGKLQNKRVVRLNDSFSSMSAGVISLLPLLVVRPIELVCYVFLFENYRFLELPWDNAMTWWFAFLGVDFGYYWVHRFGHEINFMWAAHQAHHSSEEYNLTTALRQSLLQRYNAAFGFRFIQIGLLEACHMNFKDTISMDDFGAMPVRGVKIFYLPLALVGCPPSLFLVHTQFNLLYQFWIHTEVISTLGPLEYILNTPSHHRVHHGRNRYCIDTNYGGTLIIWDRLFGTFAVESDEVVYGLVHPLSSWDAIYIQFCHWKWMFTCAWNHEGIMNKIKVFFYGPGWEPGKPRMGLIEDIPEIYAPQPVYDKALPLAWNLYTYTHFLMVLAGFMVLSTGYIALTPLAVGLGTLYLLWTLTNIGYLYEYKWYASYLELLRCLVFLAVDFYVCGFSDRCWDLIYIPRSIFMFSVSLWLLNIAKMIFDVKDDSAKKVD